MDESLAERAHPLHNPWAEPEQYRLKVQRFTHTGPLLTIRQVDFEPYNARIVSAYHRALPYTESGDTIYMPPRRMPVKGAPRKPENIERSRRRAAKGLRDAVRELCPEGMLTLTSRNRLHDLDIGRRVVARFLRAIKPVCPEFAAVIVPEENGSGEGLHFHLAYRGLGAARFNTLRRLWHGALLAEDGESRPRCLLKGSDAPGNIDVDRNRSKPHARTSRIGRYMSKYLAKRVGDGWGVHRKAFTVTGNVTVQKARLYYLRSLDCTNALLEGLQLAGYSPEVLTLPGVRVWNPPGSKLWLVDLAPLPPDPT